MCSGLPLQLLSRVHYRTDSQRQLQDQILTQVGQIGEEEKNVIYCFQLYNSQEKKMSRTVGNASYKITSSWGGVEQGIHPFHSRAFLSPPSEARHSNSACIASFASCFRLCQSQPPRNWKPWDSSWLRSSSLSRNHKVEFLE